MRWTLIALALLAPGVASAGEPSTSHAPKAGETKTFEATAYSQHGETAKGTTARPGVVAADPDVLPLGSKIEVQGAGEHSGKYKVEDTGPAIQGHKLDVFVPTKKQAKKFGRKHVKVKVLRRGEGHEEIPASARR